LGLGHLARIILHINVQLGSHIIHRRWSAVCTVILAILCVWMWNLAAKAGCSKAETPPAKPAA
jgi:hypothetical protein